MKKIIVLLCFLTFTIAFPSCKKYLDAKSDKSLQIPSSVPDLQALLDNATLLNGYNGVSFGEASADNYFMTDDEYNQMDEGNRNSYIWNNNNYNNFPNDWAFLYNVINIANIVLDNINSIKANSQNQSAWDNAKGSALFFRGYSFLQGAFIFCKAYDESTSEQDYGMALKLTSDFNAPTIRANLEETYAQIITDLKNAMVLLPDLPVHVLRPSKSSCYALLARTYLSMRSYDSCLKYADLSLKIKSDLINYNSVASGNTYPFSRFNEEDLFDNIASRPNYYTFFYGQIDTTLYDSYAENDLRKVLFFKQNSVGYYFTGSYAGYYMYIGLATDEVYLMRAESYARLGNKDAALSDLNTLLETRWLNGTYVPFEASTSEDALGIILKERRKELVFSNLRWMDIKRLNKEGANISLTRIINGNTYTLPPNDNRFALALPSDIIKMTGMPQNSF
jgi:hypothetical protein